MHLIPQRQTLAHSCFAIAITGAPACPAMVERAVRQSHRQSVLARYAEEFLRMGSGLPGFAADAGKAAVIGMRPRDSRKVAALPGEAERGVQKASRLIDIPERPKDHSEPHGGNDPVIE